MTESEIFRHLFHLLRPILSLSDNIDPNTLFDNESRIRIDRFASDPSVAALFCTAEASATGDVQVRVHPEFRLPLGCISAIILFKSGIITKSALSEQISCLAVPFSSASKESIPADVHRHLHLLVRYALSPLFLASQAPEISGNQSDTCVAQVQKRIADLELALAHLMQNDVVHEPIFKIHPEIKKAVDKATQLNQKPSTSFLDQSMLESQDFINSLQLDLCSWVRDIQRVTLNSRDIESGSALQEINYWQIMERILSKIEARIQNQDIDLVFKVLKQSKRNHVVESFYSDTGLEKAIESVKSYNLFISSIPLESLLGAPNLTKVRDAIDDIFSQVNRKIKISSYPVFRCTAFLEAISQDLMNVCCRFMRMHSLKSSEFRESASCCSLIFETWDICAKDFGNVAKELIKIRGDAYCTIQINSRHQSLRDRLKSMVQLIDAHLSLCEAIKDSNHSVYGDLEIAFNTFQSTDLYDLSVEGEKELLHSKQLYDSRVARVEDIVIADIRLKLLNARNSIEMFCVFEKHNNLLSRPQIKAALRETQTQLLDFVRMDVRKIQSSASVPYHLTDLCKCMQLVGIPPVSGAVSWSQQMIKRLDVVSNRLKSVLGLSIDNHADGIIIYQECENLRKKLDPSVIVSNWIELVSNLSFSGPILSIPVLGTTVDSIRICLTLDGARYTMYKEVALLAKCGFSVPESVLQSAQTAENLASLCRTIENSLTTFYGALQTLKIDSRITFLVDKFHRDFQNILISAAKLDWKDLLSMNNNDGHCFVQNMEKAAYQLDSKIQSAQKLLNQITLNVEILARSTTFEEHLKAIIAIQNIMDNLSISGFSNVEYFVYTISQEIDNYLLEKLTKIIKKWSLALNCNHEDNSLTNLILRDIILQFDQDYLIQTNPGMNKIRTSLYTEIQKSLNSFCLLPVLNVARYRQPVISDHSYLLDLLQKSQLACLYQQVDNTLTLLEAEINSWKRFRALWQPEFVGKSTENLSEWIALLKELDEERRSLSSQKSLILLGPYRVESRLAKAKICLQFSSVQKKIIERFCLYLQAVKIQLLDEIIAARTRQENFISEIASTTETVSFLLYIQDLSFRSLDWRQKIADFEAAEQVLKNSKFAKTPDWVNIERIRAEWSAFSQILTLKQKILHEGMSGLAIKVKSEYSFIQQKISDTIAQWHTRKPTSGKLAPNVAIRELERFSSEFKLILQDQSKIKIALEVVNHAEISTSNYELLVVQAELKDLTDLWALLADFTEEKRLLFDSLWKEQTASGLKLSLDRLYAKLQAIPVTLQQYEPFVYLLSVMNSVFENQSIIFALLCDAMQERHWIRVLSETKCTAAPNSLTLGVILGLELQKHESMLRETISNAQKERILEEYLASVAAAWNGFVLELVFYHEKCMLIKGWDVLFKQCSEHLTGLISMQNSPNFVNFRKEATMWHDRLRHVQRLFDVWIQVQRQWVYLEGVFDNETEIQKQLPTESARFQRTNAEFLSLMDTVAKNTRVLDVILIPDVYKTVERLSSSLIKVRTALSEFLENQRELYPRFYFLGDDDMLEMIGSPPHSHGLQQHLQKLFPGIESLQLTAESCVGVVGYWKEHIDLCVPVKVYSTRVNVWLSELEKSLVLTLKSLLVECISEYKLSPINLEFIRKFPSQILCLASRAVWTSEIEAELDNNGDLGKSASFVSRYLFILSDLAQNSSLSVLDLRKIHNLVLVLVNQQDTILKLKNVTSKHDFRWHYYMRYYSIGSDLQVKIGTCTFLYGFEYQGAIEMLVQTPLTEQCYFSQSLALVAGLGGSPFGPAGTGKTETVKSLAAMLGRHVLVFCCDEKFDFQAMGRLFMGICRIGAWGCFDEFNRLEERMLSAVSEQIQAIQRALKILRANSQDSCCIEILKRNVKLCRETGIFITMNPSYSGRRQLPDNLQRLFLACAMTKPDNETIARVMLYSRGFKSARSLAFKIISIFNASIVQLSNQTHYDFGLRALKSVLTSAGLIKMQNSSDLSEERILANAINETIVPKLISSDAKIFMKIINENFPLIELRAFKIMPSIEEICKSLGIELSTPFLTKIHQLERLLALNHGVILVGQSGSGKTCCRRVLAKLLNVQTYQLDPKAISKDVIFGNFDNTTRDWKDGILTNWLRKINQNSKGELEKSHWIIFDGDIDPDWVENLNSVLDDNKVLTLPNGERIALSGNVRIIFEVDSLKHATPATISRCGMLWFAESLVTLENRCSAFLESISSDESIVSPAQINTLAQVIQYLEPILLSENGLLRSVCDFCENNSSFVMSFSLPRFISCLFNLLRVGVLFLVNCKFLKENYSLSVTKLAMHCVFWAFGADSNAINREALSRMICEYYPDFAPPNISSLGDFQLSIDTGEWEFWSKRVPKIELELQDVLRTNVVIPTTDTLRHEDLVFNLVNQRKCVILCGPPGSGKSMSLINSLKKIAGITLVYISFSASADPNLILKALEQNCTYTKYSSTATMIPNVAGTTLALFCDEINLPAPDAYGTQHVISFLRQLVANAGFWHPKDHIWVSLERVFVVGACNPPTDLGRNSISDRFLRHAFVLHVDYPGNESLVQIYSAYASAALKLVPSLRGYAECLAEAMVDCYCQAKNRFTLDQHAHYVFSPRDLTRWVRGIFLGIKSKRNVTADDLFCVWMHEGMRLFQDRLASDKEIAEMDAILTKAANIHFCGSAVTAMKRPLYFTDWLSGEYRAVDPDQLTAYLTSRARAFSDEETGGNFQLVISPQLITKALQIDRVFKQSQGHMLLIGQAGSGRRTIVRLLAWLNNATFIELNPDNYGTNEFDDDLRRILTRAGAKEEKVCFLIDESSISSAAFVERINSLLASAEIPGLFEQDVFDSLMAQCKENAHRNGKTLEKADDQYDWFVGQVMKNLHIVFTMSPPSSNSLASKTVASPALFNRCVISWFGDWDAVSLSRFAFSKISPMNLDLNGYKINLDAPFLHQELIPKSLEDAICNYFALAHQFAKSLEPMYSFSPIHFIDCVCLFVNLVLTKRKEKDAHQQHIKIGLEKINETVSSVAEMRKILRVKQNDISEKSIQAEEKLKVMVAEQEIAEKQRKETFQLAKALEQQHVEIAQRESRVLADLAKVEPAVEEARKSVIGIRKQQLTEVRSMANPPDAVKLAMESICVMLGYRVDNWKSVQTILRRDDFINSILNYDTNARLNSGLREKMRAEYLSLPNYSFEIVDRASKACGPLVQWAIAQVEYAEIIVRVDPLRAEVKIIQAAAAEKAQELQQMNEKLAKIMEIVAECKREYAELVAETQMLTSELCSVSSKVERAVHLLASLDDEKERWSVSSQKFESQVRTVYGDAALCAVFATYACQFDLIKRERLWRESTSLLMGFGLSLTRDLKFVEYMSCSQERLNWTQNGLVADVQWEQNIAATLASTRYALFIDPDGGAVKFLKSFYSKQRLVCTSFLNESVNKQLETALRFGNPIIITDAERIDALYLPLLNRDVYEVSGRVLVQLGKKSIDISPTFKLFLATRNPNAKFMPEISARVCVFNFAPNTHTLEARCLSKVLSKDRPQIESHRAELAYLQGEYQLQLSDLERKLLDTLSQSGCRILDNDVVLQHLELLKFESEKVQAKIKNSREIAIEIQEIEEFYRPFASACSQIYLFVEKLTCLHNVYHFSIDHLDDIVDLVLSQNFVDSECRIDYLIRELFVKTSYCISRSLSNIDKPVFYIGLLHTYLKVTSTQMLCIYEAFLALDEKSKELDKELENIQQILNLEIKSNNEWQNYVKKLSNSHPIQTDPTSLYSLLSNVLISGMLRKDLCMSNLFVCFEKVFGKIDSNSLSILTSLTMEIKNRGIPIICCSNAGFDPCQKIEICAAQLGIPLESVAMGSAEAKKEANILVASGMSNGEWIIIKNAHLAPEWLDNFESLTREKHSHANFQLFITSDSKFHIPVNILRKSRVLFFDAPAGLHHTITESIEVAKTQKSFLPHNLAMICYLHSIIVARRRYKNLGWTKNLSFGEVDLEMAIKSAKDATDASDIQDKNMAISIILCEGIYGARIDTKHDKELLDSYVKDIICTGIKFETLDALFLWAESLQDSLGACVIGLPSDIESVLAEFEMSECLENAKKLLDSVDKQKSILKQKFIVGPAISELRNYDLAPAIDYFRKKTPLTALDRFLQEECQLLNRIQSNVLGKLADFQKQQRTKSTKVFAEFQQIENNIVPNIWINLNISSSTNLKHWLEELLKKCIGLSSAHLDLDNVGLQAYSLVRYDAFLETLFQHFKSEFSEPKSNLCLVLSMFAHNHCCFIKIRDFASQCCRFDPDTCNLQVSSAKPIVCNSAVISIAKTEELDSFCEIPLFLDISRQYRLSSVYVKSIEKQHTLLQAGAAFFLKPC